MLRRYRRLRVEATDRCPGPTPDVRVEAERAAGELGRKRPVEEVVAPRRWPVDRRPVDLLAEAQHLVEEMMRVVVQEREVVGDERHASRRGDRQGPCPRLALVQ